MAMDVDEPVAGHPSILSATAAAKVSPATRRALKASLATPTSGCAGFARAAVCNDRSIRLEIIRRALRRRLRRRLQAVRALLARPSAMTGRSDWRLFAAEVQL